MKTADEFDILAYPQWQDTALVADLIATLRQREEQVEKLFVALRDAEDGLREMRGYVDPYYAEKWDHDGYIDRVKAAIAEFEKPEVKP